MLKGIFLKWIISKMGGGRNQWAYKHFSGKTKSFLEIAMKK